jgi:hypothetical protein
MRRRRRDLLLGVVAVVAPRAGVPVRLGSGGGKSQPRRTAEPDQVEPGDGTEGLTEKLAVAQ